MSNDNGLVDEYEKLERLKKEIETKKEFEDIVEEIYGGNWDE